MSDTDFIACLQRARHCAGQQAYEGGKEEPSLSENSIAWGKQSIKIEQIRIMNRGM